MTGQQVPAEAAPDAAEELRVMPLLLLEGDQGYVRMMALSRMEDAGKGLAHLAMLAKNREAHSKKGVPKTTRNEIDNWLRELEVIRDVLGQAGWGGQQ
jgi:hypothetical protein